MVRLNLQRPAPSWFHTPSSPLWLLLARWVGRGLLALWRRWVRRPAPGRLITPADEKEAVSVRFGTWPDGEPLPEAVYVLPPDGCRLHGMVPLHVDEESLWLGMDDPDRAGAIAAAARWSRLPIHVVVLPESRLYAALVQLPESPDGFSRVADDEFNGPVRRALVALGHFSPAEVRALDAQAMAARQPLLDFLGSRSEDDENLSAELMGAFYGTGWANPREEFAEAGVYQHRDQLRRMQVCDAVPLGRSGRFRRVAMLDPSDQTAVWLCESVVGPMIPLAAAPAAIRDATRLYEQEFEADSVERAHRSHNAWAPPDPDAPVIAALRARGLITDHVAQVARLDDPGASTRLTTYRLLAEADIADALGEVWGVPTIDLDTVGLLPDLVDLCGPLDQHRMVPVRQLGRVITVATAAPGDLTAQDALRFRTGHEIQVVAAAPAAIERTLERWGHGQLELADALRRLERAVTFVCRAEALGHQGRAHVRAFLGRHVGVLLRTLLRDGRHQVRLVRDDGRCTLSSPGPVPFSVEVNPATAQAIGAYVELADGLGWVPAGIPTQGAFTLTEHRTQDTVRVEYARDLDELDLRFERVLP